MDHGQNSQSSVAEDMQMACPAPLPCTRSSNALKSMRSWSWGGLFMVNAWMFFPWEIHGWPWHALLSLKWGIPLKSACLWSFSPYKNTILVQTQFWDKHDFKYEQTKRPSPLITYLWPLHPAGERMRKARWWDLVNMYPMFTGGTMSQDLQLW